MRESARHERDELLRLYADAAGESPLLGVATDAGTFLVDVRDQVVGRGLFIKHGRGDAAVLERAIAVLDDLGLGKRATSGWFLDAGANIGTSSVAALTRHGFAGAICIEPDIDNLRLLDINAMLNDVLDRVRVIPTALSDRSGRSPLVLDRTNFGNHRLAESRDSEGWHADDAESVDVAVTSIDGLVASGAIDPTAIGMLWMDIQGHEARCLAGASTLLEHKVPIVFELYPSALDELGGCASILASLGSSYDRIVDLRVARVRPEAQDALTYEATPLTALESFAEQYKDGVTDVLVVPRVHGD